MIITGAPVENLEFEEFGITLVKPKNLQISTKIAYQAFDNLKEIPNIPNYLEFAVLDKYKELEYLHSKGLQMSGSGPTYFIKAKNIDFKIDTEEYLVINNLKSINYGVSILD